MKDTFRYTLLPVLLGANARARLLAERYRLQYRVRSYIFGEAYHISLFGSFALHYRKLSRSSGYSDFILSDLIRLASEYPDKLPVLIGTTPHYNAFIRQNQHRLEKHFILSDPELSFLVKETLADAEFYIKGERA